MSLGDGRTQLEPLEEISKGITSSWQPPTRRIERIAREVKKHRIGYSIVGQCSGRRPVQIDRVLYCELDGQSISRRSVSLDDPSTRAAAEWKPAVIQKVRRQMRRLDCQLIAMPGPDRISDGRRWHPVRRLHTGHVYSTNHVERFIENKNLVILLDDLDRSSVLSGTYKTGRNTPHTRIANRTIELSDHLLRRSGCHKPFPGPANIHHPATLQSALLRSDVRRQHRESNRNSSMNGFSHDPTLMPASR